jgi:ribosome maturation factor RimP
MDKQVIDERIREIAAQVAEKHGLELVHAEAVGAGKSKTVRVFIDKPGGVTHQDCATVDHEVGEILEQEDLLPAAYTLEISSPGLERELYSLRDFERFAGNLAKVKTRSPIAGQRNFRGRITRVEGEQIFFEDRTSGEVDFPYDEVAKANLEFDLDEELKRKE